MSEMASSINTFAKSEAGTPPIFSALQDLTAMVTDMDVVIDRLKEKVQPIVGPDHPRPTSEDSDKKLDQSNVANAIQEDVNRLRIMYYRLNYLLDRIEL